MKIAFKTYYTSLLCLFILPASAMGAASYPTQPIESTNIPIQFGPSGRQVAALSPQLPNGAANLEEVWIQDGGAREYWNTVITPRQLKMGGAAWIDPALTPQLFPQKTVLKRKRSTTRSKSRQQIVKSKAPKNAASTALKSPAIPLPLTQSNRNEQNIPPLTASSQAKQSSQGAVNSNRTQIHENSVVTPPPLQ